MANMNEIAAAGCQDFTTLMLRNIPRRDSAWDLVRKMEETMTRDSFDFVFVPCAMQKSANRGFAFVNFRDNATAVAAIAQLTGEWWTGGDATKPAFVKVDPAHMQGRTANLQRYYDIQGWTVLKDVPLLFDEGVQVTLTRALAKYCQVEMSVVNSLEMDQPLVPRQKQHQEEPMRQMSPQPPRMAPTPMPCPMQDREAPHRAELQQREMLLQLQQTVQQQLWLLDQQLESTQRTRNQQQPRPKTPPGLSLPSHMQAEQLFSEAAPWRRHRSVDQQLLSEASPWCRHRSVDQEDFDGFSAQTASDLDLFQNEDTDTFTLDSKSESSLPDMFAVATKSQPCFLAQGISSTPAMALRGHFPLTESEVVFDKVPPGLDGMNVAKFSV